MKITGQKGVGSAPAPGDVAGARGAAAPPPPPPQDDHVSLSEEARALGRLRAEIGDVNAVRTERVEELRGQIARGEYRTDLRSVARKFLAALFGDLLR